MALFMSPLPPALSHRSRRDSPAVHGEEVEERKAEEEPHRSAARAAGVPRPRHVRMPRSRGEKIGLERRFKVNPLAEIGQRSCVSAPGPGMGLMSSPYGDARGGEAQ